MNRFSVKKPLLKILQYPQKKYLCWSLFLNKNAQALSPETLIKIGSDTSVSCEYRDIFENTCFKGFATWANNIANNRKRRRYFKNK